MAKKTVKFVLPRAVVVQMRKAVGPGEVMVTPSVAAELKTKGFYPVASPAPADSDSKSKKDAKKQEKPKEEPKVQDDEEGILTPIPEGFPGAEQLASVGLTSVEAVRAHEYILSIQGIDIRLADEIEKALEAMG